MSTGPKPGGYDRKPSTPETILVADNTDGSRKSYAERYKIFHDRNDALDHFMKIGGVLAGGASWKPGIANVTQSDVDVLMVVLEPQSAKHTRSMGPSV